MKKTTIEERAASAQLTMARQALANPDMDDDYLALKAARAALTKAQLEVVVTEARWWNKIKPAMDEKQVQSGRCRADRDGDCSFYQCPQHRDREPESTGRSCPLPHALDDTL